MQAWDSFPLNVIIRYLAGALRWGRQGSILEKCRGQTGWTQDTTSRCWKVTNLLSGDVALTLRDRLCSPAPIATLWLAAALPSPLAADHGHGGLPAVVAAATAFPQTPSLLLSFMPQLIHSLALAGCCGWAPSLARTLCGSLFLAGCVCVWGEREQRRALLLEREAFCFLPARIAPRPWGIIRQGLSPWAGQY